MTKPVSTHKTPRKQYTSKFRDEALKLAECISIAAAARLKRQLAEQAKSWLLSKRPRHTSRSA